VAGKVKLEQRAEIEKAIRYVREHLGEESLRVTDVAAATRYRERRLRHLFREMTGQGLAEHISSLRIEKARELLRGTALSVMEVAYETGFHNLSHFSRTFKRAAGSSPARFRRLAGEGRAEESPVPAGGGRKCVFRDAFRGPSGDWQETSGAWSRSEGVLEGSSSDTLEIALSRLLPEDFEVSFRFRATPRNRRVPYALHVRLCDAELAASSYVIELGENGNTLGFIQVPRGARPWNVNARLRHDSEQGIAIEFRSTVLRVVLDGTEVLRHREVFPARHAERCRLAILYWHGALRLRDFSVTDLGLPPTVPTIRLGDMLFNEGMVSKARSFYVTALGRTEDREERAELQCKIGMANLALGRLDEAELWLRRLAESPSEGFWIDRARLALPRILARRGESDLERRIAALRRSYPALSGEIDSSLCDEGDHLRRSGRFDRALRFYAMYLARPSGQAFLRMNVMREAGECCWVMHRLREARAHIRMLVREERMPLRRVMALRQLSTFYACEGRFREAEAVHRRAERECDDPLSTAMLLLNLVILQRGRGRFRDALRTLDRVREEFGTRAEEAARSAPLYRAQILCGMGRTEEALADLAAAGLLRPDPGIAGYAEVLGIAYVPHALRGEMEESAKMLRALSRSEEREPCQRALAAILAGMLLEIGDLPKEAKKIWREVGRRFPETRVHGFADVATELASGGGTDRLLALPADAQVRGELLYWAARLFEKRGEKARVRPLLEIIVREDPTRRWPAELARRRLRARR
jgi:AraC-like DNA-binding protein/tetratricopeptide (TPR) repeat protein